MQTEARRRADAKIQARSTQINVRLYTDDDADLIAAIDAARGAESRSAWVKRLVVDELLGDRQLVPRHGAVIMRKSE